MSDSEPGGDPELERRLDALFAAQRPRPEFGRELWARIEGPRREPWWRRLGASRPAWQLGAAAAALLVVAGAGAGLSRILSQPSGSQMATSPAGPATARSGFGRLPAPRVPSAGEAAAPNVVVTGGAAVAAPVAQSLPVYRWTQPDASVADAFAAGLGATLTGRSSTELGAYQGEGFTLVVRSPPAAGFSLSVTSPSPSGAGPVGAAGAYLAGVHLTPTWQYAVSSSTGPDGSVVVAYARLFPGGAPEWDGAQAGLRVTVAAGAVTAVVGDLPLPLEQSTYPVIRAPSGAALVYVAVSGPRYGYFEPAWLGPAGLTPAVAAAYLGG